MGPIYDDLGLPRELTASLSAGRILVCTEVASFTLLVVDFLQTFELELKYIWPIRWNLVNALFLFLRYVPLLHIPTAFPLTTNPGLPWPVCAPYFLYSSTTIHINTACAEAVMFIRVHAIGGRSRKLGIYLLVHFVLSMAGIFALLGIFYTTVDYAPSPYVRYLGCSTLRGNGTYLSIIYGIILFNEAAMMIFTMVIGCRKYLHSRKTPLWQVFYRQGTLYFLCLAATSMANMSVNRGAKPEFTYTFTVIQYALHNLFTTRMILHIRETVAKTGGYDESLVSPDDIPLSTIAFTEPSDRSQPVRTEGTLTLPDSESS